MSEWQPIETAPRDEAAWVLLWNGHWRGVGRFNPPYADDDEERGDPLWVDETTEFIDPKPTHWMPLPAPPTKDTPDA